MKGRDSHLFGSFSLVFFINVCCHGTLVRISPSRGIVSCVSSCAPQANDSVHIPYCMQRGTFYNIMCASVVAFHDASGKCRRANTLST
jgi:hypothetical protein